MECAPMLTVLAHELRSPAAVVSGYMRMLREGRLDDGQRLEAFTQVEAAANRITLIGQQAAALRRWLEPLGGVVAEHLDLSSLVHLAANRASEQTRLSVEIESGAEGVRVRCLDRDAWIGALVSLTEFVLRETQEEASSVLLRVKATTEACEIVVGPFARVVAATDAVPMTVPFSLAHGGQGLALTLAAAVFAAHRTQLWTAAGHHNVVGITLPAG